MINIKKYSKTKKIHAINNFAEKQKVIARTLRKLDNENCEPIEPTPYKYEVKLGKQRFGLKFISKLLDLIP